MSVANGRHAARRGGARAHRRSKLRELFAVPSVVLAGTVALCLAGATTVVPSRTALAQSDAEAERATEGRGPLVRESVRGPVTVRVRLEPEAPRIGDALVLEIEAVAEPGVELIMPEFGEALGRFQIVDFVPSEEVDEAGRSLARQRYRLQSYRSGAQRISPIAIEFVDRRPGERPAPEGADAYELLSEPIDFVVESGLAEGSALELRGAMGPLEPRGSGRVLLWTALAVLALLLAAAPFAWKLWLAQRARAAQRSAFDVARAELDALLARGRPTRAEEMDPFFVELSAIVRRYLEARFRLRSPELTTEEFLEAMSDSPDLTAAHQALLQDFLRRADLVKFAHHVPDEASVEASIAAVERFLEDTREKAEPEATGRAEVAAAHG